MKRRKLLTALFLLLAVCALALGIAAVRRAQRLPSSAGVRIPVLMYHAVGDDCWGEESLFVKPEELMARFVRGDRSRHTEGSGLGLSIAQSLTELQGGSFRLEIDGDLFKAIVSFPQDGTQELHA